jgi:hypothetical protein
MKSELIQKRSVSFRDKNKDSWVVTVEFGKAAGKEDGIDVSFYGNGGNSCGQCVDNIEPRTEAQQSLVDYWNRYHLNGMTAGTDVQEAYLSGAYEKDFKWLCDTVQEAQKNNDDATQMEVVVTQGFLQHFFDGPYYIVKVGAFVNEIHKISESSTFYDMLHRTIKTLDIQDYYTKCLFLAANDLLIDHGYQYGTGWLRKQIPLSVIDEINIVFDTIEAEEEAYTESLNPLFDMGAEDFHPTQETIDHIVDLTGYDETEAKRFLVLGMFLGYTFGDLHDTFKLDDTEQCVCSANGIQYYVGTEDELNEIARQQLHDCYRDCWVDACTQDGCNDSFYDWCEDVLNIDGFASILNHWDGSSNETRLTNLGETFYVCRQ